MEDKITASWRRFVNSLPELPANGLGPPDMEKIDTSTPKSSSSDSVLVYKLTTEVYVYQHLGTDSWFGANTLQDVTILGEMTLEQVRALVAAKKLRRKKQ